MHGAKSTVDVDYLRTEMFLIMARARAERLPSLSSEDASLLGEHAARLAKAALDGMGYFDRTGEVRAPGGRASFEPSDS